MPIVQKNTTNMVQS